MSELPSMQMLVLLEPVVVFKQINTTKQNKIIPCIPIQYNLVDSSFPHLQTKKVLEIYRLKNLKTIIYILLLLLLL